MAFCKREWAIHLLIAQIFLHLSLAREGMRCIQHADCGDDSFCKISTCDSHEGWTYPCGVCQPCSECVCNADSSSGVCPSDRCPRAPTGRLTVLDGTFQAQSRAGAKLCQTMLTVRGPFFRMESFLVDLPPSQAASGENTESSASLCDFPDAPGLTEGKIEILPATQKNMIARIRLTYLSGIPLGIIRHASIYENCPHGLLAEIEPIEWLPIPFNRNVGLAPPRYTYHSGVEELPTLVLPVSGYAYSSERVQDGFVSVALDGPAEGYRDLHGDYSGFFVYGTTRRDEDDLGGKPALLCNTTFLFERGHSGAVRWDQYTWGCKMRYPPLSDTQAREHQEATAEVRTGQYIPKHGLDIPSSSSFRSSGQNLQRSPIIQSVSVESVTHRRRKQHDSRPTEPGRSSEDLRSRQVCPAGSMTIAAASTSEDSSVTSGPTCVLCPSGRYQHHAEASVCRSCPPGFTNDLNGSKMLSDCCIQQYEVGLYNDGVETSYNLFGYSNGTVLAEYVRCPHGKHYPSGSCSRTQQNISTMPSTNESDIGRASQGACSDVFFTVQPKVGDSAVASLIALDFECPDCVFELGREDNLTISIHRVSENTIMPTELKVTPQRQPSSDFRDYRHSTRPLDHSLDTTFAALQFHHFTFNDNPNVSRYDTPRGLVFIGPQTAINWTLSRWNDEFEGKQSRYMCSYEDPGGSADRSLSAPPRAPICAEEFAHRQKFLSDIEHSEWSPLNVDGSMSPPTVIGLRVLAKFSDSRNSLSGFKIGYKFSQDHAQCRPGSFAPVEDFHTYRSSQNIQCHLCAPGKFTPTDHSTYCFDCPKGSYSVESGSRGCHPCPTGHSTVERGSWSSDHCKPFCRAGSNSSSGLEPCTSCPRGTVQDKIGSTFCVQCPINWITTGKTGRGFTNVAPWKCTDASNLQFIMERLQFSGQQITITVTWNIPEVELDVEDLVLIVKGDAWTSIRQLQWSYASAAAIGGETTCSGWVGDTCQHPGPNVKPWASIAFEMDISGPGLYSAVYYSWKRGARMLGTSFNCSVQDCSFDRNHWVRDSGLYVCKPGQFSMSDGSGPCFPCPPGTFSDAYASTNCSTCAQGYYSGASQGTGDELTSYVRYSGTTNQDPVGPQICFQCPDGTSTLSERSAEDECIACQDLVKIAQNVPFCVVETSLFQTKAFVETTPAPDVCGNGMKVSDSIEECDDGNLINGDGCSSTCVIEVGFKCQEREPDLPTQCYLSCGDGKLDEGRETCDDGNNQEGDGCTSLCFIDAGWKCEEAPGGLSLCSLLPVCGDQVREWQKDEGCDDGNLFSGDGCSNMCTIEPGYTCSNFTFRSDRCCATLELCGNGVLDLCEECDDGNLRENDGCSPSCLEEEMYSCRDGCIGPLCVSEGHCDEVLIGKQHQKDNLDVLGWLGINGKAEEVGYDVFSLEFNDDGLEGLTSHSSGLFLDILPGPVDTGLMQMFAAPRKIATEHGFDGQHLTSYQSVAMRGIYGMGTDTMQLACSFCSGTRYMHWPSGTISEPQGMMANDRACTFVISGGSGIADLDSLPKIIVVTIESLDFDNDLEVLSVGEGTFVETLRRGSQVPAEYHLPQYCKLTFIAESRLLSATWEPVPQGLRFKVTYKTILLTAEGRSCQLSCLNEGQYDPYCLKNKACAASGSEVNLGGLNSLVNLESTLNIGGPERGLRAVTPSASKSADRLIMTLAGYQGLEQELPCKFAQNPTQMLLPVTRGGELVRGLDGRIWDGRCSLVQSCTGAPNGEGCVLDDLYTSDANSCSIHVQVTGSVIREYRSDCGIGSNQSLPGLLGVAHGVIESVGDSDSASDSNTLVTILRFRRVVVRWTESNLEDRVPGARMYGFLTFGETSEFDPLQTTGMQLIFGKGTGFPQMVIDAPRRRFSSRDGMCRRLDLVVSQNLLRLPEGNLQYLQGYGLAGVLKDVRRYLACNETLREMQKLGRSSADCQRVLDLLLFRDKDSMPSMPDDLCASPCLPQVQILLDKSTMECSKSWNGEFYSGDLYKNRIYKKLHIVATARAYSKILCKQNHAGEYCRKSIYDFSEVFRDCAPFVSSDNIFDGPFRYPGGARRNGGTCPRECSVALQEYQKKYGCCAASVTEAGVELNSLLTADAPFTLDLGRSITPWTPLGTGVGETYGEGQECKTNSNNRISEVCFVTAPALCNRTAGWRPACCSFPCFNGGSKARPGDCFCSCPHGRSGNRCQTLSSYVRLDLIFAGESEDSFTHEKIQFVKQGTARLADVEAEDIEVDTLKALVDTRRTLSINMVTRVLAPSVREASRLAQKLDSGLKDGRLMKNIAEISQLYGIPWPTQISAGTYNPIAFDAWGREMCDDVLVACQLAEDEILITQGNSSEINVAGAVSTSAILYIAISFISLVLGILIFLMVAKFWRRGILRDSSRVISGTTSYVADTVLPPRRSRKPSAERNTRMNFGFASRDEAERLNSKSPRSLSQNISRSKWHTKNMSLSMEPSDSRKGARRDDFEAGISANIEYEDASKPPTEMQTADVMAKLFVIPEGDATFQTLASGERPGKGDEGDEAPQGKPSFLHYDPEDLDVGFRDVDAQKQQILNRLKYLKTLQAKPPLPSTVTPALLTARDPPQDVEGRTWVIPPMETDDGDAVIWQRSLSERMQLQATTQDSSSSLDLYASKASSCTQPWRKTIDRDQAEKQIPLPVEGPSTGPSPTPANMYSLQMTGGSISSDDLLGGAIRAQLLGDFKSFKGIAGQDPDRRMLVRSPRPLNITMAPGSVSISMDPHTRQTDDDE